MWGRKRYRGQALDRSSRRSVVIRQEQPFWLVDNFFHEGSFWIAKIPHDVESVYGQAFNFSRPKTRRGDNGPEVMYDSDGLPKRTLPSLNHVQCRFTLPESRPAELFESVDQLEASEATHQIHDFVYSVEAIGPEGVHFNMRDAISGALYCAHRFLSTTEMVFERIALEGQHVVQSAPLKLAAKEKHELLAKSLKRSHDAGEKEPYYLIGLCGTNNCTSNPFRILDRVVHYPLHRRLAAFIYRLPIRPRLYLRLRGLDVDPQHRLQLRQEFKEYLASKGVRQRKREIIRAIKARRRAERE